MRQLTVTLLIQSVFLTTCLLAQVSTCPSGTINFGPGPACDFGGTNRNFTVTPRPGVWNCVAITPAGTSSFPNRDLFYNGAQSVNTGGRCDFVLSNGHHPGAIPGGQGQIVRVGSNTGQSRGRLTNVETLNYHGGFNWDEQFSFASASVARVLEFEISQAGTYFIEMTSPVGTSNSHYAPYMRWRLFSPGTSTAWRGKADAMANGQMGSPVQTLNLQPGWYAIVAFKNNEPVGSTNGWYRLHVWGNSVPQPSGISLSPDNAWISTSAGSLTLRVSGNGFISSSEVRWNGVAVPSYLDTNGELVASIDHSLRSTAATIPVTVFNAGLGGGESAPAYFDVENFFPILDSIDPPQGDLLNPPQTMTICGYNFMSGVTSVTIDGIAVTPQSITGTSMVVPIPAQVFDHPRTLSVALTHAPPGGGTHTRSWRTEYSAPPVGPAMVNPANGHTYYESLFPLDVAAAKDLAAGLEGHLVTIADASEQAWINAAFGTNRLRWLGLERTPPGSLTWAWTTGEPLNYENWAAGEPNGHATGENHAVANWGPVFTGCPSGSQGGCWNDLPGHSQGYQVYALIEVEGRYQPNQPEATLVLDGNTGDPDNGARVTKFTGDVLQLSATSTASGMPWTLVTTTVPIVSSTRGGWRTGHGQIVNVDIFHPGSRSAPDYTQNFSPISLSLPLPFEAQGGMQMSILTPTLPDGFALSAPFDIEIRPANSVIMSGPTTDDGSTLIQIPPGFPSVKFQDSFYDEFYVNANGTVSFEGPHYSPNPSVSSLDYWPPRLAGMWSDLSPLFGGSIEVVLDASGSGNNYAVHYRGIPSQASGGFGPNSFTLSFQPGADTCQIQGYSPNPDHAHDTLVGMSGIMNSANSGGYSFSAQAAQGGCFFGTDPNQAVFEFKTGEEVPVGWTDIFFPSSNGSIWMVSNNP